MTLLSNTNSASGVVDIMSTQCQPQVSSEASFPRDFEPAVAGTIRFRQEVFLLSSGQGVYPATTSTGARLCSSLCLFTVSIPSMATGTVNWNQSLQALEDGAVKVFV